MPAARAFRFTRSPLSLGRSPLRQRLRRLKIWWLRISHPILAPLRIRWGSSLRLRTMTVTGLIAIGMVTLMGTLVIDRISSDLYSSRRDQALQDSARATLAAQRLADSSDATDSNALTELMTTVRNTVQGTSSSGLVYVRRSTDQPPSAIAPQDFFTSQPLVDVVSAELSEALHTGEAPQYWQAVRIADGAEPAPGMLVASTVLFPAGAGTYELYLGYSLADVTQSLEFITRAMVTMALLLLLLLTALVWAVSGLVFRPVRTAATVSHRLAAGETDARMPMQNDRHFDKLSTSFNHMADTLQARIEELHTLSTVQQRFVSDVSHELRTPLTTIKLAAEVLRGQLQPGNPESEPAQKRNPAETSPAARATQVLGDQVRRFESLLSDLLEISRYDAGPVTLDTEPRSLIALTEQVLEGLRPLSPSPLTLHALGGFHPIEVDARRIRRIISNLVGNAIEHGEGKPIEITIDSNAAAVAIGVRDWGIGIDPKDAVHVFDRFWRADPSRERTLGGTGLGLAIAREDAAVHGGLLEVWSRLGQGAHFRLTLPRSEHTKSFVSPVPLIPDDAVSEESAPEITGGWLRRPGRRVGRKRKQ